jgi:cje0225
VIFYTKPAYFTLICSQAGKKQQKDTRMKEIKIKDEIWQMHAPKVRTIKMADENGGSDMAKTIYMIAALCNKTQDEVENLEFKEFMSLQKALNDFLDVRAE